MVNSQHLVAVILMFPGKNYLESNPSLPSPIPFFFFLTLPCSMQDLSFLTGDRIHALLQWKLGVLTTEPLGRFLVPHPFPIPSSSNRSSTLHGCTATHHIDDLGQCHLQGDIQGLVCVCHRSQGTCVVGKEVSEQLVCQPALGSQALWRTSKKWCPWRPQGRGLGSHSLLSTRLTPCQCLHCLTDA